MSIYWSRVVCRVSAFRDVHQVKETSPNLRIVEINTGNVVVPGVTCSREQSAFDPLSIQFDYKGAKIYLVDLLEYLLCGMREALLVFVVIRWLKIPNETRLDKR